jgi:uncharacterized oxidoreductase
MKTTSNTVLITGGSAGIGFEIAKQFAAKGNKVIITGRDPKRLMDASAQIPGVTAIAFDVTNQNDVENLVKKLKTDFPELNVIVNNAGRAFLHDLSSEEGNTYEKAADEMLTNYISIIRMNERFLPLLKKQAESAIVNVSSIVAFSPNHRLATYSASKAALHSYSQTLRHTLAKNTSVKVFELMPPLVNTDFSQDIGGANGISPTLVAEDLLRAFESNTYEIHVGNTAYIYELSRTAPQDAFATMNS